MVDYKRNRGLNNYHSLEFIDSIINGVGAPGAEAGGGSGKTDPPLADRLDRVRGSCGLTQKKPKAKSNFSLSETDSISSNQSIESKEKSKLWTHE